MERNKETLTTPIHATVLPDLPNAGQHHEQATEMVLENTALADLISEQRWPTPTANRRSGLQSHGQNAILGQLNPQFVEWLQGWPIGWTDLGALATDRYHEWLRQHGES